MDGKYDIILCVFFMVNKFGVGAFFCLLPIACSNKWYLGHHHLFVEPNLVTCLLALIWSICTTCKYIYSSSSRAHRISHATVNKFQIDKIKSRNTHKSYIVRVVWCNTRIARDTSWDYNLFCLFKTTKRADSEHTQRAN